MPAGKRRSGRPLGIACLGLALAFGSLAGGGGGCKRASDLRVEKREAVVLGTKLAVRTAPLGVTGEGAAATFALVTASNQGDVPLVVVLDGQLLDAGGAVVGNLRPDELRVPARGQRVFALVDDALAARPSATTARATVRRAFVDEEPPPMSLTEAHAYVDNDRVVLAANLVNHIAKPAHVVVIAAYLDRDASPLTRPFLVMTIGAQATLPVRMVGPVGSTSGMLYLGEILY
ncbi:MAG: hypothetical protein IPL79_01430 [Myxococcales bacterium]|nr:hypothetical protein [Myxococcales bacterium]